MFSSLWCVDMYSGILLVIMRDNVPSNTYRIRYCAKSLCYLETSGNTKKIKQCSRVSRFTSNPTLQAIAMFFRRIHYLLTVTLKVKFTEGVNPTPMFGYFLF